MRNFYENLAKDTELYGEILLKFRLYIFWRQIPFSIFYFFPIQLLEKEPSNRLGIRGCKHGEVSEQPFFKNVDFEKLERKQVIPPFKPNLVRASN